MPKGQKRGYTGSFLVPVDSTKNNLVEAAMDIGPELISRVKKSTKGFFKENIENITKYWP